MSDTPPPIPQWEPEPSGHYGVTRMAVPSGGGWIYRLLGHDGKSNHTFVPDLAAWAAAMQVDEPTVPSVKVDQILTMVTTVLATLQTLETKMSDLADALAAQSAAIADLTASVDGVVADLTTEHQQLVDALAALAAAGVTPEQLATIQASTDAIGGLAGRLRQVVVDTPDPAAPPPVV